MDITKVSAALVTARTEVTNILVATKKNLADPKIDVEGTVAASKDLRILGKIDTALKSAEGRIAKATKPRAKKAKKAAAADKK
jgi:hypothetical protein